ncbi:hypothetical protein [Peribacillus asahii]|uniref:hypothetical protein n=1 Tax=Peribacillus asahii TaxID=228899 RepID=UPI00207B05CA|nr:hypothetical protein [Peribacillus asahii]USK60422.1 hypothetical protein LIT37_03465 [Peribacillus asahii]
MAFIRLSIVVIGPEPLVNEICQIATEFHEVTIETLIYEAVEQSALLVENHYESTDIFIFAGPSPYYISKENLPLESISYYIPFEGSDIYRLLVKVYETYHDYPIISFDIIDAHYLEEIYEELGILDTPYYLHSNKEDIVDSNALVDYHLNLLKEEKVQVIATTLNSVYERLKELDTPVFLIKHTKAQIRDTLEKAILKGRQQKKEEAQMIVLQFKMISEEKEQNLHFQYECKLIEERILQYGKRLFSNMNVTKNHVVTLYTTRGIFEKVTNKRRDFTFLKELNELFSVQVNLGIGIGNTAESATYNAKNALEFSIKKGKGSCFLIDEQKRVHGPLGTLHSIDYTLLNSKDENQSSLTLRKFYAWLSMMRKKEVTTREMSMGMNTSERHAARILKNLCEKNMANIIGKESISQRGRPRVVYEINLIELRKHVNEKRKDEIRSISSNQ